MQEQHTRNGEQQRQPEGLLQDAGDFIIAPRTLEMGNRRRYRLQDAGECENHCNVYPAANGHSGKILGSVMPEQHRVDHHHAHRSELGNQHWRCVQQNQPGLVDEH